MPVTIATFLDNLNLKSIFWEKKNSELSLENKWINQLLYKSILKKKFGTVLIVQW